MLVSRATPPQSEGKRGLVITCAYKELFWRQDLVTYNQIRDLNLLLGNTLLAARTHTVILHCL